MFAGVTAEDGKGGGLESCSRGWPDGRPDPLDAVRKSFLRAPEWIDHELGLSMTGRGWASVLKTISGKCGSGRVGEVDVTSWLTG